MRPEGRDDVFRVWHPIVPGEPPPAGFVPILWKDAGIGRDLGKLFLTDRGKHAANDLTLAKIRRGRGIEAYLAGWRIEVDEIGKRLHKRGILFCVDGIQTLGAYPLSVQHVDFLAADVTYPVTTEGSGA